MTDWTIRQGQALDELREMEAGSAQCCVTSPPYWGLRDYGVEGQIGLEDTPGEYVERLVGVFDEVRRVLADDGTLWLNLGDTYAGYHGNAEKADDEAPSNKPGYVENMRESTVGVEGLKQKDLVGIPWRVAFALREAGWWLRSDVIWDKPNPMPESVTDRPTSSHEHVFLLAKSSSYYYDHEAIKEPVEKGNAGSTMHEGKTAEHQLGRASDRPRRDPESRNKRDVWEVTTKPFPDAHFAVYPPELVEPCVLAGSDEGDTVLDPFCGSGTTGAVAAARGRDFVGVELNGEYVEMAEGKVAEAVEESGRLDPETAGEVGGQIGLLAEPPEE